METDCVKKKNPTDNLWSNKIRKPINGKQKKNELKGFFQTQNLLDIIQNKKITVKWSHLLKPESFFTYSNGKVTL